MRCLMLTAGILAFLALGYLSGCAPAQPAAVPQDVTAVIVDSLPPSADDPKWDTTPEFTAKLILQDLVEPRQLATTTAEVRVRALTDGSSIALRMSWADATIDDVLTPSRFSDACAVQVPAKVDPTLPAPQMGESGKGVEITYWSAAWQAFADGREDSIKCLYPNAAIDHYPFEAASLQKDSPAQREMDVRYAPARAVNNPVSVSRSVPVQDLIAEGPGTITAAAQTTSKGVGKRSGDGWVVVITRRLPGGFDELKNSQVAFAVWNGSHEEVGARKMRTAWISLSVKAK